MWFLIEVLVRNQHSVGLSRSTGYVVANGESGVCVCNSRQQLMINSLLINLLIVVSEVNSSYNLKTIPPAGFNRFKYIKYLALKIVKPHSAKVKAEAVNKEFVLISFYFQNIIVQMLI